MAEHPDKSLCNTMNFIHLQMVALARDCGNMISAGLVTLQYVSQLQDQLEKILHETRAACGPPERQPVMSDFKDLKCLGSGTYGTVNLVCHKATGQKLAMKMIARKKVTEETKDDLIMERDVLAFSSSPFVVSLFCTFETEGYFCMAMEYVGGGDCEILLKRYQRLPVDLALTYLAETTLALEYIHSYGIIHADLKPPNLLISSAGHIKLADFGVSKIGPANMTVDKKDLQRMAIEFNGSYMFGTPEYMAPEMIEGSYGKPVDWWALGIILYQFLVGRVPFNGDSAEELQEEVFSKDIHLSDLEPALPTEAQLFITQLLRKDCELRLGTAGGAGEVKAHPFFQCLDWSNLLSQEIPQLEEEEENTAQSVCDDELSPDDPPSYPSGSSEHVEWSVEIPDFCRVAYRFKEAYGSQEHLSLLNQQSATQGTHRVEEEQWDEQEQDWDAEADPFNILSLEIPQLEEEEDTAQSSFDDGLSGDSRCPEGSSDEDKAGQDSYVRVALLWRTSSDTSPPFVVDPQMTIPLAITHSLMTSTEDSVPHNSPGIDGTSSEDSTGHTSSYCVGSSDRDFVGHNSQLDGSSDGNFAVHNASYYGENRSASLLVRSPLIEGVGGVGA